MRDFAVGALAGRAGDWLEGRHGEVVPARSAATVMILRDRLVASSAGVGGADASGVVAGGAVPCGAVADGAVADGAVADGAVADGAVATGTGGVGTRGVDASHGPLHGADPSADGSNGHGIEVFMLRRSSTMEFAPRMMVFPGGGVDPRDGDPSLPWAGPSPAQWARLLIADEATAQELVVAAVREVFEECGVLLAGPDVDSVVGDVSGPRWQAARAALLSRELSLAQMLIGRGLVLRSDLLRARAHWITPEFEPKRYDTRFFAALLPVGQIADDQTSEADHADWADPARLLRDYANGAALMLPPTVVCVEHAAAASSVAQFLAAEVGMAPIMPVPVKVGDSVVMRCTIPAVRHLARAAE